MYKQIYINGSSFTYGYGLDIPDFLKELNKVNSLYPNWQSPKEELKKFREKNNWPTILQDMINIPVVNESIFGGSFERVIRMTFDFFLNQEIPSDTLYILEIPNSVRKDVWSNQDEKWKRVTGETGDWESYTKEEVDAIQKWYASFEKSEINFRKEITRLVGVCSFLKENNCDFLILPTEQLHHIFSDDEYDTLIYKKFNKLIQPLDLNLIKFKTNEKYAGGYLLEKEYSDFNLYEYYTTNLLVFYNDYLKLRFDNEVENLNDGHPNLEGHKKIGEGIYDYIQYFINKKRDIKI